MDTDGTQIKCRYLIRAFQISEFRNDASGGVRYPPRSRHRDSRNIQSSDRKRMNPHNPYAAPQTVQQSLPLAEVLSEQDCSDRRLYDDVSTERLSSLAILSRAILGMSMVWGVILVGVSLLILGTPFLAISAIGLPLVTLRVWGGLWRTPWFWVYNLILDTIFLVGLFFFWLSIWDKSNLTMLLLTGTIGMFLAGLAGMSIFAHLLASSLYVHYTHRDLINEVRYRKLNGIS